jgi:HD superfamily phosphohydrolase
MNLWHIYHDSIPDFLTQAAQAPAVQRLKGIGMNCGCEYTHFPEFIHCRPYTRFDHSMGVALIIWHFTKDKAQALSGLLHDVSTPVFAHVIDFANGDHMTQESTEELTQELIRKDPVLLDILRINGLSVSEIEDYHLYPIADNHAPMLCADRLEYTLGNAVNFGILNEETVRVLYNDLLAGINESGQQELIFRNPEKALLFAETALQCSRIYVCDADRYAMQILSEIIVDAVKVGTLCDEDLYTTETEVIQKIIRSPFYHRWKAFCVMSQTERSTIPTNKNVWRRIRAKKRYIDPYIFEKGRVSDLYTNFHKALIDFLSESQDQWICGR